MSFLLTINDIAISFLVCLPLYILRIRLENERRIIFHKKLADALIAPWALSITIGTWFLSSGSMASLYILTIVPIHLAIYFSFNKFINSLVCDSEDEREIEYILLGLSKKQLLKVSLISLFLIGIIVSVAMINGQRVLEYHQEIITEMEEAEDKKGFIINYTENPSALLSELPYLHEIKRGNLRIGYSSPWRINVIVDTIIEGNPARVEFAYNRFNDQWKLDGSYNKTVFVSNTSIEN